MTAQSSPPNPLRDVIIVGSSAGAITSTSASDGATGSAPPSDGSFVAFSNGTNLTGVSPTTALPVEEFAATYKNIAGAATTVVKSGAGTLHKLILNIQVTSEVVTLYDNTAGSGTKIGTITFPATLVGDGPICLTYDIAFATGLTIVTTGSTTDLTVVYK